MHKKKLKDRKLLVVTDTYSTLYKIDDQISAIFSISLTVLASWSAAGAQRLLNTSTMLR